MEKLPIDIILEDSMEIDDLKDIIKLEACFNYNENIEVEFTFIEEFCKFVLLKNIDIIFYYIKENNNDINNYLITEEYYDDLDKKCLEIIKDDIDEYNNKIKDLELDSIEGFKLFTIDNSVIYSYELTLEDENEAILEQPKAKIKDLLLEHDSEIREIRAGYRAEAIKLKEELKEQIKNDFNFKICSNKRLRSNYIRTMINNEDFNRFKICFQDIGGKFDEYEIYDFVELIWQEIKYSK
ncbi:hypothetical protein H8J79_03275 [Clostridium perfringens]|uniref:hypothetical protein n=1 Tax=Clostridium perfringens TaxID=1502 RepID=UPI0018E48AF5|nr:hypothetical protein [Clostridium perfringens]ELC8416816.1 hypothetical protein [Clostridium perfringens]MBI6019854.1 hypothetical protein [Clostridium perfringens]